MPLAPPTSRTGLSSRVSALAPDVGTVVPKRASSLDGRVGVAHASRMDTRPRPTVRALSCVNALGDVTSVVSSPFKWSSERDGARASTSGGRRIPLLAHLDARRGRGRGGLITANGTGNHSTRAVLSASDFISRTVYGPSMSAATRSLGQRVDLGVGAAAVVGTDGPDPVVEPNEAPLVGGSLRLGVAHVQRQVEVLVGGGHLDVRNDAVDPNRRLRRRRCFYRRPRRRRGFAAPRVVESAPRCRSGRSRARHSSAWAPVAAERART